MPGDKVELSFWEHITELLRRLRVIFIAVAISSVFVMAFPINFAFENVSAVNPWYTTVSVWLIKRVQQDLVPSEVELLPISWFAPLEIYLFVSVMLGVVISSPVIMYEIYKFINPALHMHERKSVLSFVAAFSGLFVFGVVFGYVLIMPASVRALLLASKFLGLPLMFEFSEFFSLVVGGVLLSGFMFTFPVFLILLVKAQVLKTNHVTRNRKTIYPGLVVLIAIFDPDPTIITEVALIIPIIILTEVSVLIARRYERERAE